MRLQAYEGDEPFVFISYAHKDTETVMRVLTELDRRGYRIWYDDGIAPGSEWPENIAEHLTKSAMVLAFISQNSIDSPNCRREVTFALSKRKPFLSVVLERAEMSPGMELQLSAQQSVIRINYEDETSFINKICSCPDIKPCQKPAPESAPVSASAPAPASEPTSASAPTEEKPVMQPASQPQTNAASAQSVPAEQAKPRKEKTAKAKPAKAKPGKTTTERGEKPSDNTSKKKGGLRIGLIVLGVILALLVIRVVSCLHPNKTPQTAITDSVSVSETSSYVKLEEETITQDVVSNLKGLERLISLDLVKCTIEDSALSGLAGLPLTTLKLTDVSGISDYSFINDFESLKELTLIRCGVTDKNISLASNDKLTLVNLTGNTEFTDLNLLNCAVLKTINISETGVTDLSPLAGANKLTVLYASDTKVTDISPLASLTGLNTLVMNRTGVKTIDVEFQSLRLQVLQFADCGITSMSGFENLTVLRDVDLSGNQLADISWLYKSAETLQTVRLAGNPLTDRLQQLSECKLIQVLDISGIPVHTLWFAEEMTDLTEIYAKNCLLTSIEQLSGKTKLKIADLSDNQLTDFNALSQFDSINGKLDLSNNEITALSPIVNVNKINLIGNDISYAQIPETFKALHMYCEYNTDLPGSGLADRILARLGVVNVPADKQVELENASLRIHVMTEDEVQEAMQ
ncbi:MAG: TIR domain-containing protein [Firmicutes bacterium]|nr:TIR domain-containing protein [Bacillota bacterium]